MAISLSGSLELTGSLTVTGGINMSGSIASASYASNAELLDGRDSLTFANTGSNSFVGTQNINGAVAITGSLTTTGAITAQTINVQQVTSSIVYSSGSNIFGNSVSNTQSMTGSVGITGSLSVNGAATFSGNTAVSSGNQLRLFQSNNGNFSYLQSITNGDFVVSTGGTANALIIANNGTATFSGVLSQSVGTSTSYLTTTAGSGLEIRSDGSTSADRNIIFKLGTTTRVLINNDGNVGIGTATPSQLLHVAGTAVFTGTSLTGNTAVGVYIYDQQIISLNGGNARPLNIQGEILTFYSGATYTERMCITSGGSVGIGTSNPAILGTSFTNQFTVSTTSGFANIASVGATGSGGGLDLGTQTIRQAGIYSLDGSNLALYTNGTNSGNTITERMRITSGGSFLVGATNADVGGSVKGAIIRQDGSIVGASNISSPAHYQSPIAADRMNTMGDGLMYGMWRQGIFQAGIGATNASVMTFFTGNNDSMTERMRIASGGNVGIGTTDPLGKLTINNTADNTTFLLTTVNGNTRLVLSTDASANALIRSGNNVDLRLGVNEDAIVIKNGGNVGIGTTSPATTLHVVGGVRFSSSGADANRWSVYWNGGTGDLIVVNNISDIRAKKDFDYNIKGLETIKKLKPLKFTWKDGTSHSTSVSGKLRQYGFIAQETMEADDYLAWHNTSQDTWGIEQYESFTAVMVKAIQEQQAQIEELKLLIK